jgi:hypothetical protein
VLLFANCARDRNSLSYLGRGLKSGKGKLYRVLRGCLTNLAGKVNALRKGCHNNRIRLESKVNRNHGVPNGCCYDVAFLQCGGIKSAALMAIKHLSLRHQISPLLALSRYNDKTSTTRRLGRSRGWEGGSLCGRLLWRLKKRKDALRHAKGMTNAGAFPKPRLKSVRTFTEQLNWGRAKSPPVEAKSTPPSPGPDYRPATLIPPSPIQFYTV